MFGVPELAESWFFMIFNTLKNRCVKQTEAHPEYIQFAGHDTLT